MVSAKGKSEKGWTNSLFLFGSDSKLLSPPYNKMILVPFGEYMPGGVWLSFLKRFFFFGDSEELAKGDGLGKIAYIPLRGGEKPPIALGLGICYESLFDELSRDLAKAKADILINSANDNWFGNYQARYQNLYMTLSRAIEVRRPLIRGTNSGFSAMISAKGDISYLSPVNQSIAQEVEVPYYSKGKHTMFMSYGYYINIVVLWVLLVFFHLLGFSL